MVSGTPRDATEGAWLRWLVLFLACAGLFGQFYAYDNPSALNKQLQHLCADANFNYDFNLLYSTYSVPNMLLPIVLGIGMDRWGVRRLIALLAACVVVGHILVAIGTQSCNWRLMWIGRATFGMGGESIQIAQTVLLFRWFKGKEIALALGLNISVARVGSVLNDVLSPWVAAKYGLPAAFWVGSGLCCMSAACNLVSVLVDYRAQTSGLLPEETCDGDASQLKDAVLLPKLFWLLAGYGVVIYSGIVSFNNIASAFIVDTFFDGVPTTIAQQQAGNIMSLMYLVSAIGTPIAGGLVDRVGLRAHMMIGASVAMIATFLSMQIMPPAVSMFSLGLVYTIFAAALWPAYTLAVPERQLGVAYGLATSLQNGGLAVTPLLVAFLQAGPSQFASVLRFFAVLGVSGFCFSIAAHVESRSEGVRLDLPSQEIAADQGTLSEKQRLLVSKVEQ